MYRVHQFHDRATQAEAVIPPSPDPSAGPQSQDEAGGAGSTIVRRQLEREGPLLASEPFMLVFRFLHIVAGVLWVGSAFLFSAFIGPSAAEVGPSAGPLLTVMVKKRKVPMVIKALSGITVLAG